MTKKQQNELLIAALKRYKEKQLVNIPFEKDINYTFSDAFNKKMDELLNNKSVKHPMRKVRKKISVIIVAVILAFTVALSIGAFREKLVNFFFEIFYDNTHYLQEDFDDGYIEDYYILPVVPDGFEKVTESIDEIEAYITYENSYGSQLDFVQGKRGADGSFNSEGSEVSEIEVNGKQVLYCDNGRDIFCYWTEHNRNFHLIYPSYLTDSYMYDVVGNLRDTEPITE